MFPHLITIQWSEADGAYVARVPAIDATAHGKAPEGAVREVVRVAEAMIADGAEVRSEQSIAGAALGRMGGAKGGKARAASLSKAKRAEIAKP
ncbi:MAG TPA: hypothetical protein VHG72_11170, partial [Polyangia bacterium]|nr:hypothetical protein [Polyangia bacterium]